MRHNKKHAKTHDRNPASGGYELNRALPMYAYAPAREAVDDDMATAPSEGRPRWKKILITGCILIVLAGLGIGGWLGYKFIANEVKVFGWNGLFSLFHHTKLKGEDRGRVNILVAGNSSDDVGHNGANLTDSIMLVSLNTAQHTAFLMSIPRDLYVDIPDNGYAKINETYPDGQADNFSEGGYPDGGMGLLEKVVSQKLGVPIDYYALVDYSALRDAVNAVGGVQFNVQSNDSRGLYDPSIDYTTHGPLVNLSNGVHTLNGQQALDLARARGDAYGAYGFGRADFDRTANQRQLIVAIKDKATSASTLSNPLKVGQLFDSFGNNVTTDMKLGEARRFYDLLKQTPNNKITSAGLNEADGKSLLSSYTTDLGQSALIPGAGLDDYSAIQAYVSKLSSQ